MPRETFGTGYRFLPRTEVLNFEEIVRLAGVFKQLGVRKIRITGGEPLLRRDLDRLVAALAALGGLELTLTTNGILLPEKAAALKAAGLDRLTVSLDALDEAVFRQMADAPYSAAQVLDGIAAAEAAGFGSVKVNMVVKRGVNDNQIMPLARHFRGTPHVLRFIEFMDVGTSNGWRMDEVLPSSEVIARIAAEHPLTAVEQGAMGEVAERWIYADGKGEIGVISSVTRPFCHGCTRLRLSTEGQLYTCLFATAGFDLRARLRSGADDEILAGQIGALWRQRQDRYSELRTAGLAPSPGIPLRRIEMSYIGG
jgi:cyclic pyranopterin phosphate synthase